MHANLGCAGALTDTGTSLDLVSSLPGSERVVESRSCGAGAAELWKVQGGDHFADYVVPATTEGLIDWLLAHPKP